MSLRHILLGMLAEPQSGYDLKKCFDQSLRNFWHAELSQIYPQLKKLEDEGLLTSRQVESPSGPPRRVYARSAKGRQELLDWLHSGPRVGNERMSYLAQVFFLSQLEDFDAALRFMLDLRDRTAKRLAVLETIDREWMANDPRYPDDLPDEDFYAQLTLALGLKRVKATLEWCDESIARIEKRQEASRRKKRA